MRACMAIGVVVVAVRVKVRDRLGTANPNRIKRLPMYLAHNFVFGFSTGMTRQDLFRHCCTGFSAGAVSQEVKPRPPCGIFGQEGDG